MSGTHDGRASILIADDDSAVRDVLHELLSVGYKCVTVRSAEEALEALRTTQFHLVISDITMGGMTGLEMVPHVIEFAPDTVILMISGAQTIESAIDALRVGAFDYVMKPFDLRHVEAAVRRALDHHELLTAKRRHDTYLQELVEQRTAELNRTLSSLEDAYRATLKALVSSLEMRDAETHGHSERVVNFSLRLGRELDISDEQTRALELGSMLHDIGKIGVPDMILRKPGSLTEEEWVIMRKHPALGRQILHGIEFLEKAVLVVGQHHEKWDGTGYPLGLRGEAVDLNARIFAVADAFDAMTSDRVYRASRPYEAAAAELDEYAGKQFDAQVVEAFHRVPREEWDELRSGSLHKQIDKMNVQNPSAPSIDPSFTSVGV